MNELQVDSHESDLIHLTKDVWMDIYPFNEKCLNY